MLAIIPASRGRILLVGIGGLTPIEIREGMGVEIRRLLSRLLACVVTLLLCPATVAYGQVGLSINDVSQTEGELGTTTFTFTVTLTAPAAAGGVTFDIATASGSATSGIDYVERSFTGPTIPAGSSTTPSRSPSTAIGLSNHTRRSSST